jgi:YD repeat-containing protein
MMPSVEKPGATHDFSLDAVVPPNPIEGELAALRGTIGDILDALAITIRDDDQLRDAIVRYRCLHPEVLPEIALQLVKQELFTIHTMGAAAADHIHTPDQTGADATGTAVAGDAAHVAAADPHGQYFNAARGDARFAALDHGHDLARLGAEVRGTAIALMASHEADNGNPHRTTAEQVGAVPIAGVGKVYEYYGDGKLWRVTDAFGSKTFTYDEAGKLASITGTGKYKSKVFIYVGNVLVMVEVAA